MAESFPVEYCKFCQENVQSTELTTAGSLVVEVYCSQCNEPIRAYRKQLETQNLLPPARSTEFY